MTRQLTNREYKARAEQMHRRAQKAEGELARVLREDRTWRLYFELSRHITTVAYRTAESIKWLKKDVQQAEHERDLATAQNARDACEITELKARITELEARITNCVTDWRKNEQFSRERGASVAPFSSEDSTDWFARAQIFKRCVNELEGIKSFSGVPENDPNSKNGSFTPCGENGLRERQNF